MEPFIEELCRWRVGDPVRTDVQRRWQQDARKLDETVVALRERVASLEAELDEATKPKGVRR